MSGMLLMMWHSRSVHSVSGKQMFMYNFQAVRGLSAVRFALLATF